MHLKLSVFGLQVEDFLSTYKEKINSIFDSLLNKSSPGIEMTGWIEWVNKDHSKLLQKSVQLRDKWKSLEVETVVIIGTGGSYIGSKAALDFYHSKFKKSNFEFIFVASFSDRYLSELLDYLKNKKFSILVVSKSGTTLESAVSFRFLRDLLWEQHKNSYLDYLAAVTDSSSGVLRSLVNKRDIFAFEIENDIGGRYSALTAVGLVPMILSGIDGSEVLSGAQKAYKEHFNKDLNTNSPSVYAAIRHYLFSEKKLVSECLCSYDPHLGFLLEKMKQLFAESEGKSEKGLMPIIMNFTPDLHSVGQLMQDGYKSFFETIVLVSESRNDLVVKKSNFDNDDELDWLCGQNLKAINHCAYKGTLEAHSQTALIPNVVIELQSWSAFSFGYVYYWLSLAAMFSAYLFEVNPFNQPGVETYKKRMFSLLKGN